MVSQPGTAVALAAFFLLRPIGMGPQQKGKRSFYRVSSPSRSCFAAAEERCLWKQTPPKPDAEVGCLIPLS